MRVDIGNDKNYIVLFLSITFIDLMFVIFQYEISNHNYLY